MTDWAVVLMALGIDLLSPLREYVPRFAKNCSRLGKPHQFRLYDIRLLAIVVAHCQRTVKSNVQIRLTKDLIRILGTFILMPLDQLKLYFINHVPDVR